MLRGPGRPRAAPSGLVPLRPVPVPTVDEKNHPEAPSAGPVLLGEGIAVGCGHRKVSPGCIGVDLIARGDKGEHGVVANQTSVADIQASGDDLHMFGDGELDYVMARHNLEHYMDVVKTLCEWRRVLKPGGVMAIVVPDERAGDTVRPTSIASLRRASSASSTRSAGLTCSEAKSSSRLVVPDGREEEMTPSAGHCDISPTIFVLDVAGLPRRYETVMVSPSRPKGQRMTASAITRFSARRFSASSWMRVRRPCFENASGTGTTA